MTTDSNDLEGEHAKFDLGVRPPPRLDRATVPWGYGADQITALVRSPDALYVYWEITDDGIARARSSLGVGPSDGWFCLRIYDTTNRPFDGLNAHHHFDLDVDRGARDHFMTVGRPGSSAHIDIGVKLHDGRFFPIARSGRADFPRRSPSPNASVEWMTVSDQVERPAARPYRSRYTGHVPPLGAHVRGGDGGGHHGHDGQHHRQETHGGRESHQAWTGADGWHTTHVERTSHDRVVGQWSFGGEARSQWLTGGGVESEELVEVLERPWLLERWRTEWRGGFQFLTWMTEPTVVEVPGEAEAFGWQIGPFAVHDIPAEAERVELDAGPSGPIVMGGTSSDWGPIKVYGPWKVTIRGFEKQPERRVIASWTMHWVRTEPTFVERWSTGLERRRVNAFEREQLVFGASEGVRLREVGASEVWRIGASERLWMGASAWMQLGASEVWAWAASQMAMVGASALTWRGASHWLQAGASGWLVRGAGEWLAGGATERMWLASSQWLLGGATERAWMGASEWVLGGASERAWVGASEWMLGGASEGWSGSLGGSEGAPWSAPASPPGGATEPNDPSEKV